MENSFLSDIICFSYPAHLSYVSIYFLNLAGLARGIFLYGPLLFYDTAQCSIGTATFIVAILKRPRLILPTVCLTL